MAPRMRPQKRPASATTKKRPASATSSYARLSVFTKGVIWGLHLAGTKREDMTVHLAKTDGSDVGLHAIDYVIAQKKSDPDWEGEGVHTGRPVELSASEQNELVQLVFKERG